MLCAKQEKMKIIISIIFLFISANSLAESCLNHEQQKKEREEIRELINSSSFCNDNSECKLVYLGCPFGCATAINVNKEQKVVEATQSYHAKSCSKCMYKCKHYSTAQCINNICVAKWKHITISSSRSLCSLGPSGCCAPEAPLAKRYISLYKWSWFLHLLF